MLKIKIVTVAKKDWKKQHTANKWWKSQFIKF